MKVDGYEYHSALGPEVDVDPLERWEGNHGLSLTWDLAARGCLPLEFAQCDVLYAEPPFPAGWKLFHDRAGVDPAMTYKAFIALTSRLIYERGGVLIVSKQAERYALAAQLTEEIKLHKPGWTALAKWYCAPPARASVDVDGVLGELASRFHCVGDFCGGYGHTAEVFVRAGKRYVMSDVVARCAGYISQQEWA